MSTGTCQICFCWDSDAIAALSGRQKLHVDSLTPTYITSGGFIYIYGAEDLGVVKYR